MNIRKTKKEIKKLDDDRFIKTSLKSLKYIKQWSKKDHQNSKSNMRILTGNFWRNGGFV
jgi:hypothetical protein